MGRRKASDPRIGAARPGISQDEVQPWHRVGGMEHICELRKSSSVLYAMLVSTARSIYADRKGRVFGCPSVVWKPDPERTEIWIDTELRWEDMRPDFLPAIFVRLGEIAYEPVPSISPEGLTYVSPGGEMRYERTGSCSATFAHVGTSVGEACCLADNTENFLSSLQGQIADQYCFESFVVRGRVPVQKGDSGQADGRDRLMSAVQVSFSWADAWSVKIESPILKTVGMKPVLPNGIFVSGTPVDVTPGVTDIRFGDLSSETDTPVDN